jgi:hypothetical protein
MNPSAKNQDLFLGLGGLKPLLKCLSMSTLGDAPRSQQKKWAGKNIFLPFRLKKSFHHRQYLH